MTKTSASSPFSFFLGKASTVLKITTLASLLFIAGCQSTNRAYVDFNKEGNFSNLTTFTLAKPKFKVEEETVDQVQAALEKLNSNGEVEEIKTQDKAKEPEKDEQLAKYGISDTGSAYEDDENAITIKRDKEFKNAVYQAIAKQLSAQNYQQKDAAADFDVTFSVVYSEKPSESSMSIGVGTGSMGSRGGFGINVGGSIPINDNEMFTDIIIDISRNNVAIWHGRLQYERKRNALSSSQLSRMSKTVEKILAKFPPEQASSPAEK